MMAFKSMDVVTPKVTIIDNTIDDSVIQMYDAPIKQKHQLCAQE